MNKLFQILLETNHNEIKILKFKKDVTIFNENETTNYVGIVLKGTISIESYSFEGKLMVFNIIKQDQMFGNNLIFSSNPKYKGNVVCKSDVELVLINKDKLTTILQTNKDFLIEYLKQTSDFSKNLNYRIKLLSFDSLKDRFLYHLEASGGSIQIKSVTNLANELNVSREAMSRTLSVLINKKVIIRDKNIIKLV